MQLDYYTYSIDVQLLYVVIYLINYFRFIKFCICELKYKRKEKRLH